MADIGPGRRERAEARADNDAAYGVAFAFAAEFLALGPEERHRAQDGLGLMGRYVREHADRCDPCRRRLHEPSVVCPLRDRGW